MFPEGSTVRNQSVQISLWLSWKKSYGVGEETKLAIPSKWNSRILEGKNEKANIQNEMQKARNKKDSLYNRLGVWGI